MRENRTSRRAGTGNVIREPDEARSESDGIATGPYSQRASPRLYPGGVMMAQAFFPQRVLVSEERSGHYVRASMCALRGKGQARARPAPSVPVSPLNGANQGFEDKLLLIMVPATR